MEEIGIMTTNGIRFAATLVLLIFCESLQHRIYYRRAVQMGGASSHLDSENQTRTPRRPQMALQRAYLGMQCFWGESALAKIKGIRKTRVGYAGGSTVAPTYRNIGDHTEITEVQFDPSMISYEQVLAYFWSHHDPRERRKKQYQSAILWVDDQQSAAEKSLADAKKKLGEIETYVKKLDVFYQAENYHQKYWLRQQSDILKALHLTDEQIADSVLAAKMNAYCAAYDDFTELLELQKEHGLSDDLVKKVEVNR